MSKHFWEKKNSDEIDIIVINYVAELCQKSCNCVGDEACVSLQVDLFCLQKQNCFEVKTDDDKHQMLFRCYVLFVS